MTNILTDTERAQLVLEGKCSVCGIHLTEWTLDPVPVKWVVTSAHTEYHYFDCPLVEQQLWEF